MTFQDFNFEPELLEGLDTMGFSVPTPIQAQAIPAILANKDLIACAQTGTGKTAAFLLPVINKIIQKHEDKLNTLIIVPTRELAVQIDQSLQGISYFTPVTSICIYGGNDGNSFEQEKKALTQGVNIIIATPGRLIAHLNMGYVKISQLQHLILDEADRMLDMGFGDDINRIITYLPKQRQNLLFSATMPPRIRQLAAKLLHEPEQINIALSKPAAGVMQAAYFVRDEQKFALLTSLLEGKTIPSIIIFSSKKETVKLLARELKRANFNAASIHSDLEQVERNDVLQKYRARQIQVLVATDILSRGIDIDSIGLVINFDVPRDAEDYVHRVGRTARAESTGVALTFINPADHIKFKRIEKLIESTIQKVPVPVDMAINALFVSQKPKKQMHKRGR